MKSKFILVFAIIAITLCSITLLSQTDLSDSSEFGTESSIHGDFLIDYGNGATDWIETVAKDTIGQTISATLIDAGHECILDPALSIDGMGTITIGSTATSPIGSLSVPGTTGLLTTSSWNIYIWNETSKTWENAETSTAYDSQIIAVGFYPIGFVPVATPEYKATWTSYAGDSANTSNQEADITSGNSETKWSFTPKRPGSATSCYGSILYVQGYSFVKWGYSDGSKNVYLTCYETETGDEIWTFKYPSTMYETTTPVIGGNNIYVQSSKGYIYTFDWKTGPGINNVNVKSFNGEPWNTGTTIPNTTNPDVKGEPYGSGPTSMVFNSGCLFTNSSNGMTYCFDSELNLIWSFQSGGRAYFSAPTVFDNYVAAGFYDGTLYILDKRTGSLLDSAVAYWENIGGVEEGSVSSPAFLRHDTGYTIVCSVTNGEGMNSSSFGIVSFEFDGTSLTLQKKYIDTVGLVGSYFTTFGDKALICTSTGTYTIDAEGTLTKLSTDLTDQNLVKAQLVFVNGKYLYASTYNMSISKLFVLNTEGKIIKERADPSSQYAMSPVIVVDGYILCGNDGGAFCIVGDFSDYIAPSKDNEMSKLETLIITAIVVVIGISLLWAILRYGFKWEHPLAHLKSSFYTFLYGEQYSHNKRSKHRLWLVLIGGFAITTLIAILSLCVGSETTLGPVEAIRTAISSIQKGGKGLSYEEMLVFNSRLPRTIAAIAVGIGLSIAGAVYQAVIKNPLVEPYIMGVSSGAGTLAVAVMVYDFTFFGLVSPSDPFLTAIASMIGGLLAFGLTMLMAIKTGGRSMNYVLAGIVIGLVFGAVQSIMMIMGGNNIASSLSWLYGSFTSITWQKVWLVLIPVLALSMIPIVWAKELNLVLLGEDQAKQMGLDAAKFDRWMLILASILTAFCVAFCGIIGFVGLVIPHLCRMIMGGDHRLMLPTAMALGGFLMVFADLCARVLVTGYELPVGAITTVIGVPVFAYLLIKRGRSYDM